MRTKGYSIAVLIVAALFILGWTAHGQKQDARQQTWEYKAVLSSTKDFQGDQTFNALGAQGWELVAASGSRDAYGIYFVFKRPK